MTALSAGVCFKINVCILMHQTPIWMVKKICMLSGLKELESRGSGLELATNNTLIHFSGQSFRIRIGFGQLYVIVGQIPKILRHNEFCRGRYDH